MNDYLLYAKILKEIKEKRGNFKSIIFNKCQKNNVPSKKIPSIFAIIIKIYKNFHEFSELLLTYSKKNKAKVQNPYLFMILLSEFYTAKLSDKKTRILKMGGKLLREIKDNETFFMKELSQIFGSLNTEKKLIRSKIFIRTIEPRISTENLTKEILDYYRKKNENNLNSIKPTENNKNLSPADLIVKDKNIPNAIWVEYNLYSKCFDLLNNRIDILLQGKSSCFPPYVLLRGIMLKAQSNPKLYHQKFKIIDTCSAPGNKTLQLAEYMNKFVNCKILAFEKDEKRFKFLAQRVKNYGFEQKIECINKDFLTIDTNDKKFSDIHFALIDPSCSGSGMRNQLYFEEKTDFSNNYNFEQFCVEEQKKNISRVENLSNFQIEIINKCMDFPKIKRISYSTCSLFKKENEDVVENILKNNNNFELIDLKGKKSLGEGFGNIGKDCLRANPFQEEIDGFFVALFKRKK